MERLTLNQAIDKFCGHIAIEPNQTIAKAFFKEGAEWHKEQCADIVKEALNKFQEAVKLLDTLVYYSNIRTVDGVQPANMLTHKDASNAAKQWLRDNCTIKEGEYLLIKPEPLQY